jgi:hypothetical protein
VKNGLPDVMYHTVKEAVAEMPLVLEIGGRKYYRRSLGKKNSLVVNKLDFMFFF